MRYGFGSVLAASCIAALTSIIGTAETPAYAGGAPAQSGQCTIAGTVFVAQLGRCILTVTNPVQIQQIIPDITTPDPKCFNAQGAYVTGFRYDTIVPAQNGKPQGVAHHVCGVRPVG